MKTHRMSPVAFVQKKLAQMAVILVASAVCALFGQQCVPPDNKADSGTIKATVLVRTSDLLAQSGNDIYDLDPPEGQRQAFVSFREGDVVEVTYADLLTCRSGTYTADVVGIIKKGVSPVSSLTPRGASTMIATLTGKEEVRNDKARRDFRHISVNADRGKYGGCAWSFEVSLDNPLYPTLKRGDMLRITYFNASHSGAMPYCFGTVWRLSVVRSGHR